MAVHDKNPFHRGITGVFRNVIVPSTDEAGLRMEIVYSRKSPPCVLEAAIAGLPTARSPLRARPWLAGSLLSAARMEFSALTGM